MTKQRFRMSLGTFFKNLFTKNILLKVVSLVFAMLLWGYVITIENPDYIKTVSDVEISIVGESTLKERGLMLVDRSEIGTTDVDVLCAVNKHHELDSRVTCSIDLSSRAISLGENEDERIVSISVNAQVASGYGTVSGMSRSTVEVRIAKIGTRARMPVNIITTGAQDGYEVTIPTEMSITNMEVEKAILDEVASAQITIDLSDFAIDADMAEETFNSDYLVTFFDAAGNELSDVVTPEGERFTIDVSATFRAYREVVIQPVLNGTDAGYTWQTAATERVRLYGSRNALDALNFVQTTEIAPRVSDASYEYTAQLVLPDGVTSKLEDDTVTLTLLPVEQTETRTLSYAISYRNFPNDLQRDGDFPETIQVTVSGPYTQVAAFENAKAVTAYVDLAGYGAGTYTIQVIIEINDQLLYEENGLTFTIGDSAVTFTLKSRR